jgi:prophage regulatory protein
MSKTTSECISDAGSGTQAAAPFVSAPPRLIRLPEVMARVGLKRSSIYQRMSDGRFPRGRSLGAKCTVWVEAEIDEWICAVVSASSVQTECRDLPD